MKTLQIDQLFTLKTTECCVCGVIVAMPASLYDKRLNNHKSFWCPNGHSQHFTGKSDADRLADQLEQERRRVIRMQNQLDACPADGCGRSFVQLQRHLKSKHPELAD